MSLAIKNKCSNYDAKLFIFEPLCMIFPISNHHNGSTSLILWPNFIYDPPYIYMIHIWMYTKSFPKRFFVWIHTNFWSWQGNEKRIPNWARGKLEKLLANKHVSKWNNEYNMYIYICKDNYIIYICHIHIIRYIFSEYIYICIDALNVATIPFPNQRHLLGDGFPKNSWEPQNPPVFFPMDLGVGPPKISWKDATPWGFSLSPIFFKKRRFWLAILSGCYKQDVVQIMCSTSANLTRGPMFQLALTAM